MFTPNACGWPSRDTFVAFLRRRAPLRLRRASASVCQTHFRRAHPHHLAPAPRAVAGLSPASGPCAQALRLGPALKSRAVRWPEVASLPDRSGGRVGVQLAGSLQLDFRNISWSEPASHKLAVCPQAAWVYGSAETTVAYRRHPSSHASPTCPPFPPRVAGTPRVCAPVCARYLWGIRVVSCCKIGPKWLLEGPVVDCVGSRIQSRQVL